MEKFDQIIASKLNSASYAADEQMWHNIEQELPAAKASGNSNYNVAFWGGIAASALLLFTFSNLPIISEHPTDNLVSIESIDPVINSSFAQEIETAQITVAESHTPQENHEIDFLSIEVKQIQTNSKTVPELLPQNNLKNVKIEAESEIRVDNSLTTTSGDLKVDFKAIGIQCIGNEILFTSIDNPDSPIRWLFDGVHVKEGNRSTFAFTEAGTHEVMMIVDAQPKSYSITKSIEIFDNPSPIINYSVQASESCFKQAIKLNAEPGLNNYQWTLGSQKSNGSNSTLMAAEGNHIVQLNAISSKGCVSHISQEIIVEGGLKIFIPNSFTPDNDGHNDEWFAKGLEKCSSFTLQIFRATDQSLVYETVELKPWNGELNGSSEKPNRGEKFVYRIIAKDDCGYSKEISGTITAL